MNSKQDILNYVKHKSLKNAFNSDRDCTALFPPENFDFSATDYTHFIYFAKEEATAYLYDFLLFIKNYYNEEVFSYENYFSIFDEFKKYCENNKIFLYTKTKMGLSLANYSNELLLNMMQETFGKENVAGNETNIAFSEKIINKSSYSYPFFDFLSEKTKGYNNFKYIVEPLISHDIEKIKNYYKGISYGDKLPFYLDPQKPYWKDTKNTILSQIVTNNPTKVFAISEQNKTIVSIIIAEINNNKCNINILCDCDYYNSELSYPIEFICRQLFDEYDISKITTINKNKGIAFSTINSVLVISHFKPSYNSETTSDGFSKIEYELSKETNLETEIQINNSVIKFAL